VLQPRRDGEPAAENAQHLVGVGVGRHIEVVGLAPEQQIPHAPAYEVGLKARAPKFFAHAAHILRNGTGVDRGLVVGALHGS